MAKYLLMLRDNGTYNGFSAEEMQRIFERYRSWSGKLRAEGEITGGEKLRGHQGREMKRNGSKVAISDGPCADTKEGIGGLFIVVAKNYDRALPVDNG